MRIKLGLLILFVSVTNLFAQDMAQLRVATEKMYEATYKLDFKGTMDLTYPKIFELSSREMIIETLKESFSNEMVSISFPNAKTDFKYGEIKTIGKQKFCVIKYNNVMRLALSETVDEETVDANIQNYKSGYKKVDYDKKARVIWLENEAIVVATSDELTENQWKFTNYDSMNFTLVFDENIKKALGL